MKVSDLINWLEEVKKLNPNNSKLNNIIVNFKTTLTNSKTESVIKDLACPYLLEIIELNKEIITKALENISYDEGTKTINSPRIEKIRYPKQTPGMIFEEIKRQVNNPQQENRYENEEILFIVLSLGLYAYFRNCVGKGELDAAASLKIALAIILPPVAMAVGILSLFFKPSYNQQNEQTNQPTITI